MCQYVARLLLLSYKLLAFTLFDRVILPFYSSHSFFLLSDDFARRPGVLVATVGGPPHRRLPRPARVQLFRQPGKCCSIVQKCLNLHFNRTFAS